MTLPAARAVLTFCVLPAAAAPGQGVAQVFESPYAVESVEIRYDNYEGPVALIAVALTRAPSADHPEAGIAPGNW